MKSRDEIEKNIYDCKEDFDPSTAQICELLLDIRDILVAIWGIQKSFNREQ